MSTQQSTLQLGSSDSGVFSISIDPNQVVDAANGNSKQLRRWLYASGLGTMVMDAATVFYSPPRAVIFEQHKFAYYAALAGIFAAGLAEVAGAAFWLSSSGGQQGRSRAFAAAVFCASVVPLVGIIALGGFSVVMKD